MDMTTILQIKQLYKQSFKDLENDFAALIIKGLAWLTFASIAFVAFAVIYKAVNGYEF